MYSGRNGSAEPGSSTAISHPCWLEVDLDLVRGNVAALRRLLPPGCGLAAVVKADAYGLGAVEVARAALEAGASWLGVARVEEGVRLRKAGLRAPILNLAYTAPLEAATLVEYAITPTVADRHTARAIAAATPPGTVVEVHLKVDTGLSRFGAQPDELPALVRELCDLQRLRVQGLSSHFATADEPDPSFARFQLRRFFEAERLVRAAGACPTIRHLANSAATLALPEARLDLVRPGITLSGHYPSADVPPAVELSPAVTLRARVARVYDLPPGAAIGYNRTFVTRRSTRGALIPIGYADGLPRAHSGAAQVLIRGRRAPLVGRVSMDQCVVDVTDIPKVSPGDEVVLFGRQGAGSIPLEEYAAWGGTISHESLCRIGPRVPRYYRAAGSLSRPAWPGMAVSSNGHRSAAELLGAATPAHP